MLKILNKIFQIFIDLLVFIITVLILFSLYKLIAINIYHKPYANTLGYTIFEIATGSMEPTLNVKDLIIVKITKNISVNDIVTYQDKDDLITHRVIDIDGNNLITKGDANNSIDVKINKEDIIGKVIYTIPNGGLIRELFLTPKIVISVVITLILISICLSLNQKKSTQKINSKKIKTVKENKKIKENTKTEPIIAKKEIITNKTEIINEEKENNKFNEYKKEIITTKKEPIIAKKEIITNKTEIINEEKENNKSNEYKEELKNNKTFQKIKEEIFEAIEEEKKKK